MTLILARLLIAQLFALGAIQKLADAGPAMVLLSGLGLPSALVWPALALNAALAAALIAGWRLPEVALVAAVYCAATSVFHFQPDDPWQMTIFVKNWALAGGCLALRAAASPRPPRPRG